MGTPYPPSKADALSFDFTGLTFIDPGTAPYAAPDGDRIDSEYFLKPVQDEVLGLIWGSVAASDYDQVYNALPGLAIGTPVYVSADNTVDSADSLVAGHSKVVGFVRQYITATTCTIAHYAYVSAGLVGFGGANEDIYLDDSGAFSPTPGTIPINLGRTLTSATGIMSAMPAEAVSGYSGFSGYSGMSGTSGFTGCSGFSGTLGLSGDSGVSGYSGVAGSFVSSGFSGFSGVSGFSGTFSGYSGYSGASGAVPNLALYKSATKSATEARNTNSLADDADLNLVLDAGTTYYVEGSIGWSGVAQGSLLQNIDYTGTYVSCDINWMMSSANNGGYYDGAWTQVALPSASNVYNAYTNGMGVTLIKGCIETTLGGTLKFRWGGGNSTQNGKMWKDSFIAVRAGDGAISGYSGQGAQGDSGVSGFSGTDAGAGYSGPSGASGYSGFSSESGASGTSGASGASGFTGLSGFSGTSGWSAFSGKSGTSGWSGMPGISGLSGQDGSAGPSGGSGKSGFSGLGLSGWSGVSGFSATDGAPGGSGDSGTSGWSGKSGARGVSGYSGIDGSGVSGKSGFSGAGTSGWSGMSGFSAAIGPIGLSGTSGQQGVPGDSGASGFSGCSGFSGVFSGASGQSGSQGPSGASGKSGTSGYSGSAPTLYQTEQIILEGAGEVLTNGVKCYLNIGYNCEIVEAILVSDATGDLEIELWRQPFSGFPPSPTDNIVGALDPIELVGTRKWNSVALTGWTKTLNQGDWLACYVVSASCISNATLALRLKRL